MVDILRNLVISFGPLCVLFIIFLIIAVIRKEK